MKFKISNEEIKEYNQSTSFNYPKYTSQIINLANQNAQGTRPKVVGQMSELFTEFTNGNKDININNWSDWYEERYPESIKNATNKIFLQIEKLKSAINLINIEMVENWVKDLVISKTYNGMYIQKAILAYVANIQKSTFSLSTPSEESLGIDGFIGNIPYSIKPITYKTMSHLPEIIEVKFIYYEKTKDGIIIEVDE